MQDNEVGTFPSILRSFEKNTYTITLLISAENVNSKSTAYEATSIFEGVDFIEQCPSNTFEFTTPSRFDQVLCYIYCIVQVINFNYN